MSKIDERNSDLLRMVRAQRVGAPSNSFGGSFTAGSAYSGGNGANQNARYADVSTSSGCDRASIIEKSQTAYNLSNEASRIESAGNDLKESAKVHLGAAIALLVPVTSGAARLALILSALGEVLAEGEITQEAILDLANAVNPFAAAISGARALGEFAAAKKLLDDAEVLKQDAQTLHDEVVALKNACASARIS